MKEPAVRIVLKPGREKSARNHHPWVFSGGIASVEGESTPGVAADLFDSSREFLARGFANSRSQIAFRALTFKKEPVDAAFLARRIETAVALRTELLEPETDAYRLVHGEGDLLPGLVVDRYADWLSVQFGAAGMDVLREPVLDALERLLKPRGIWERSEGPSRREEGLEERSALARGEDPGERVVVRERGLRFAVDVKGGHKTGFYIDQRPGRALVRAHARGKAVLDVFAYSGAFSVAAVAGGAASVTAIDSSDPSLTLLAEHLAANELPADAVRVVHGDAFRKLRDETSRYGLIVVDPPPFAKRKAEVDGACRGYKDVNLHAMKLLAPGGLLLTSSCSHHVDPYLFQQVLYAAAKDAGRAMQLLERRGQPWDHPVSIHHPEGEYLKVFLLRAAG